MTSQFETQARPLRERYAQLKAGQPKARIRNLAGRMAVSEMDLVAAGCGAIKSTLLKGPVQDVFKELGALGRVMALTRNDWCVHERHGRYEDIKAGKTMGIVLGPDIDLRMFFGSWQSAWAVDDGGRLSIQFFDAAGSAVHKVYITADSDAAAYRGLVARFEDPDPVWPATAPSASTPEQAAEQAPAALRDDWLAMEDTHDFHGLLQRHNVSRLAALRGAGADLAQQVSGEAAERVLKDVAERDIAFMCFVGNKGMIQIHSGPIKEVARMGPWVNVLEPHFNLHLDTTAIASSWVVNKPSKDGWITSLECYAGNGDLIVQFFGARKPGIPELTSWRQLLVGYCSLPLA